MATLANLEAEVLAWEPGVAAQPANLADPRSMAVRAAAADQPSDDQAAQVAVLAATVAASFDAPRVHRGPQQRLIQTLFGEVVGTRLQARGFRSDTLSRR